MKLPGRRSVLGQYVTLAGASLLSAIFGFLVATLLARQFGPAGFGAISLAAMLLSYAVVIANAGMPLYAVRTIAMGQSSLEQMIPVVISTRLLLSTVVLMGLAACAFTIPQLNASRYLILLFGMTLFSKSILLSWVPQAMHKAHVVAASNVMLKFLNLCLLYFLLMFNAQEIMAPIALLLAEAMVAAGLIWSIRRYVLKLESIRNFAAMVAMLRESSPIGLSQLMRAFAMSSDLIILGLLTTYTDVGIYAAGYKIFIFMLSLGSAYFIILLPRMAAISTSNRRIKMELKLSFQWALPIMACAVLVVWFTADFAINLLFGVDFTGAGDVLRVLSLAMVANIVAKHYRQVLLAKKLQNQDSRLSTFSAFVHVLAKLMLIPVYGIIGCAIGTLIGELFLMIMQHIAVRRKLSSNGSAS